MIAVALAVLIQVSAPPPLPLETIGQPVTSPCDLSAVGKIGMSIEWQRRVLADAGFPLELVCEPLSVEEAGIRLAKLTPEELESSRPYYQMWRILGRQRTGRAAQNVMRVVAHRDGEPWTEEDERRAMEYAWR